ncbi:phosphoglycerate mutase family protein [Parahaliea aestuarii]|uniref:Histidine phosphatase family protein n=1 Tax=Parahaliea aestuarii TaxID=1852021 RepID=A0A5C8ZXI3_9GAMM|nr:phosphoglycerate mutase family protein [Parahaliea aestuarii]TXS93235.1 histidine phosphatase family protein [Parahaliea aestuarii]
MPHMLTGLLLLIALAQGGIAQAAEHAATPDAALTVFLVRHGEKTDDSDNPPLSAAGQGRARLLAQMLRSAGIQQVHSSDFLRTHNTAAPTAIMLGQTIETYDVDDLPALARQLQQSGGRHLVVGHSDTTPELVDLLGGTAGQPIDEAGEYDRLYIVTVNHEGAAVTTLLRYGEPFLP